MADPLSIAGLALTACDALLKLGERTTILIHDARSFNEDTEQMHNKIRDENTRTRLLRHVLFEPSPVYGGLTLFQKFSDDAQDEIQVSLNRLIHILEEACGLLEKHYRPPDPSGSTVSSLTTSYSDLSIKSLDGTCRTPSPRSPWRSFPRTSIMILRWSFHDKKRTNEILRDFADQNSRIHEKVKLLSLASDIGLNLQHLRRLQKDESSKQLGFDIDATLQLKASCAQADTSTFELEPAWNEALRAAVPIEEGFALLEYRNRRYLQEFRRCEDSSCGNGLSPEVDERTKERVNDLARLLHQPKEQVFCIPACIGWKYLPGRQNIAFIFDLPEGAYPEPMSLFRILDSEIRSKEVKTSISERLRLALALAKCVAQLQMVKWVHESFRSENILFFPQRLNAGENQHGGPRMRIDYSQPLVLGFEFSRPEIGFSAACADICMDRDVYRHPDRQGRPGKLFTKIHDIYALGVVLLEIGLWQRAITLEKNHFKNADGRPQLVRAALLKQADRRLGDKMGEKYQQIVTKCLSGDFGVKDDTKEDLKLQLAFRTQVVDVLERAASCI